MTLQQVVMLALQASILMTVFGFGLRATVPDILHVTRRPALLGRSLVAMFVVMPIVAVAMAEAFDLRPAVEIALVALAISPIPPLLPGREDKAGGDAPYALGLMVIVGALSIVTVPASVALLSRYFGRPFAISSGAIAQIIVTAALLPLAAGLAFRAMLPAVAGRIAKPMELVAKGLLATSLLAILVGTLPTALSQVGDGTVVAMAVFVVAGLAAGHWLGGPNNRDRLVLALTTSNRHPAIALALAKTNFPDEPYLGATILLYLLVGLLISVPYQVWQKRSFA